MSTYTLHYRILSKPTPPSSKVLKGILDDQAKLNRDCTWSHERLSLAPVRQPNRLPLAFPFVQFAPSRPAFAFGERPMDAPDAARIGDASVAGSTKVRTLWDAHVVAAFLKHVSTTYPELRLELRDDGNFVLPGAVWMQNGKVELHREWLNRERERALEMSGDANAAGPFVWAEAEALQGRFFVEGDASDFADLPEVRALELNWDQLRSVELASLAEIVVDRITSFATPVAAKTS